MKYDLYAVIVHSGSTSSSGHYCSFICTEPNEWYKFDDSTRKHILCFMQRETLWFSDFVALQLHNVETICLLYLSLPNNHASYVSESNASAIDTYSSAPRPTGAINSSDFHELTKIAGNELKKTVQMSTLGSPSSINSSKENNTSQDIGVTERMTPLLPKSLDQVASENQWQMDPEKETEIMLACSMIKKRVLGPRGEQLMAALSRLGSLESSVL
ncbi:hypothetical protein CQW23_22659 [Capsicum baccatum]|uniref:USP domain-containing protein n=1 Tax=Capsicum baccatum TaxID=33114 RepID=A0A2G2W1I0_CAPBA|nr:hypothetical protein CQW23_22659 [Capsicum baccatum]